MISDTKKPNHSFTFKGHLLVRIRIKSKAVVVARRSTVKLLSLKVSDSSPISLGAWKTTELSNRDFHSPTLDLSFECFEGLSTRLIICVKYAIVWLVSLV